MKQFNPTELFQSLFNSENVNAQQVKAKELVQSLNAQAQKQLSKAPQRIQENIEVATQNFNSLQSTIQESLAQFQDPQACLSLWSKHITDSYNRNVALISKQHQENLENFQELKSSFESASEKVKEEAESNFKAFQSKAADAVEDIKKHVSKAQEELKDNIEIAQTQTVKAIEEVVKQATTVTSQVQDQISKGVSHATKMATDTASAVTRTTNHKAKSTKADKNS